MGRYERIATAVDYVILKWTQNWPKMGSDQAALFVETLTQIGNELGPEAVKDLGLKIRQRVKFGAPVEADIWAVYDEIYQQHIRLKQQREDAETMAKLPKLTPRQHELNRRIIHNLSTTIGAGYDYWLQVMHALIQECKAIGESDLAAGFEQSLVKIANWRRDLKQKETERATINKIPRLPAGYVNLKGGINE